MPRHREAGIRELLNSYPASPALLLKNLVWGSYARTGARISHSDSFFRDL